MTDSEKDREQLFKNYSLRVAIACVLGAMPLDQRQRAKAAMSQHMLALEEAGATGLPGAPELAAAMAVEFDSLEKAASLVPTYISGVPRAAAKRPRAPAKTLKKPRRSAT